MKTILPAIATVLAALVLMLIACNKDTAELKETTATVFRYGCSEKMGNSEMHICYDSLTYDSRCPEGGVCVWAGYVEIRIRFYENAHEHSFKMLLHAGNQQHYSIRDAVSDTVINGYKIKLTDVLPHPKVSGPAPTADQYKAVFSIAR